MVKNAHREGYQKENKNPLDLLKLGMRTQTVQVNRTNYKELINRKLEQYKVMEANEECLKKEIKVNNV